MQNRTSRRYREEKGGVNQRGIGNRGKRGGEKKRGTEENERRIRVNSKYFIICIADLGDAVQTIFWNQIFKCRLEYLQRLYFQNVFPRR